MSGFLTFPTVVLDRAFTYARLEILLDEDWQDSFALTEGEKPLDLSGKWLELWTRPSFGHATLIRKLSSASGAGGEIYVDDALNGGAMIFMRQADVAAAYVPGVWQHFLRLCETGADSAARYREIWRGDLVVHPGRTA